MEKRLMHTYFDPVHPSAALVDRTKEECFALAAALRDKSGRQPRRKLVPALAAGGILTAAAVVTVPLWRPFLTADKSSLAGSASSAALAQDGSEAETAEDLTTETGEFNENAADSFFCAGGASAPAAFATSNPILTALSPQTHVQEVLLTDGQLYFNRLSLPEASMETFFTGLLADAGEESSGAWQITVREEALPAGLTRFKEDSAADAALLFYQNSEGTRAYIFAGEGEEERLSSLLGEDLKASAAADLSIEAAYFEEENAYLAAFAKAGTGYLVGSEALSEEDFIRLLLALAE